jgi:hypothetical protein
MNLRNELFQLTKRPVRNYAVVCIYFLFYPQLYERLVELTGNRWESHRRAIRIFFLALTSRKVKDISHFIGFLTKQAKTEAESFAKAKDYWGTDRQFVKKIPKHYRELWKGLNIRLDKERVKFALNHEKYSNVNAYYLADGDRRIIVDIESILTQANIDIAKDNIRRLLATHSFAPTFANEGAAWEAYRIPFKGKEVLLEQLIVDYFFEDVPYSTIANEYGGLDPGVYSTMTYALMCRALWERWPLHIILYRVKHKKRIKERATTQQK